MNHREAYELIILCFEKQKDLHPLSNSYKRLEDLARKCYNKFLK